MRFGNNKFLGFSALLAASAFLTPTGAAAHSRHHAHGSHHIAATVHHRAASTHHHGVHYAALRATRGTPRVIQCVAFAKQDAGIQISGNARDWWSNAAGVYERGSRPEPGSVLSFRANSRMPLGHVAVVSDVADSRTIVIEQSHWNSRGISRDIEVKDVSEDNDWSAVRVQLGHGGGFGAIYPTHGFIYPRPDSGLHVANLVHAPIPVLDRAPADLRGRRLHARHANLEVAEAPAGGSGLDLSMPGLSFDAPNRALR
jgi:surface antigen